MRFSVCDVAVLALVGSTMDTFHGATAQVLTPLENNKRFFQDHSYQLFQVNIDMSNVNYDGAKADIPNLPDFTSYCENGEQPNVVTINSQGEQDFVAAMITTYNTLNTGNEVAASWIGLEQTPNNAISWTWVTGEGFSGSDYGGSFARPPWFTGEPNQVAEECAIMIFIQTCCAGLVPGEWVDVMCTGTSYTNIFQGKEAMVVEWPCHPTKPSQEPSLEPSAQPSLSQEPSVSSEPSSMPSSEPSSLPSVSGMPSEVPSEEPSVSSEPSSMPSSEPSSLPSVSGMPSEVPSEEPSVSSEPSESPSSLPSISAMPSAVPSEKPSSTPSSEPSQKPSVMPSVSSMPSSKPSDTPMLTCKSSATLDILSTQPVPITMFPEFLLVTVPSNVASYSYSTAGQSLSCDDNGTTLQVVITATFNSGQTDSCTVPVAVTNTNNSCQNRWKQWWDKFVDFWWLW